MRRVVKSLVTVLTALVGLVGGTIWAVKSNWDWEPVILLVVSFIEVVAFITLKSDESDISQDEKPVLGSQQQQQVSLSVNVGNAQPRQMKSPQSDSFSRDQIIDLMKPKINILFIDDDKNFNVVKILKDSGWKNTKTVADVKSIDSVNIKENDIFFVDINGVGKQLELQYEGLDLALMLKQRYPAKKVVIYSANKNFNSFHAAWDTCDFKLEKNALPYQFQNLVEEFSIGTYSQRK